jgi:MFS family permease
MRLKQPMPALKEAGFKRFLLGAFASQIGNQAQIWAIAWHVYALTGSSLMVGYVALARVIPLTALSLFGGILADQKDRRKVMLVTQALLAAVSLVLCLTTFLGWISVGLIYALVAIQAAARAFDGPARQSLLVSLVPTEALPNAVQLNGICWRISDVTGPLITGFLIASFNDGIAITYAFNLVTFLAMGYSLIGLKSKPPLEGRENEKITSVASAMQSLAAGITFVRKNKVVRSAMLIDFWATFFSSADALLPAFATSIFDMGPEGYGALASSQAIGALGGAIAIAVLPTVKKQGAWVIGAVLVYGLCTLAFGLAPNPFIAFIALAGAGAADMISTVLRQTIRMLATPDHMRGRMSSVSMLFQVTGPQLGDLEAGVVAKLTGERLSVVIGGIACVGVAALWARGKSLKQYELQTQTTNESSVSQ